MRDFLKRASMQARAWTPPPVRAVYRALRPASSVPPSQALPREVVRDCRMFADRLDMLDALPKGGIVAELGTYKGDFAREIAKRCAPRELHLIDIDYTPFNPDGLAKAERHVGLTHDVIGRFPDAHFDWIYVDGDHSYAGAVADIRAAIPKVRPGGYLVFNDFAIIDPWFGRYGVHAAVSEFAVRERWPMAFFAYEAAGLYDVAFRRPA